jgi:hypothetical protein
MSLQSYSTLFSFVDGRDDAQARATRDVPEALRREEASWLPKEWHLANPNRKPAVEAWDRCGPAHGLPPVSYAPPVPAHAGEWWKVLNNGLNQPENERLTVTVQIPEMVARIFLGLRSVCLSRP